jgi:T-complex protein 1 subunit gamma
MQTPILIMNTNTERDEGKRAQFGNIAAAKAVSDIVRTTLGPRSMLKMILDPMGGIVLTNDGNAILREIDVNHPAAKSMLELSRTQDEEVGDGTTSVIILAGEMLQVAEPFLERRMHPRTIVSAYNQALIDAEECMKKIAIELDVTDSEACIKIIRSTIGTKFIARYGDLICNLALDAVQKIRINLEDDDVKDNEDNSNSAGNRDANANTTGFELNSNIVIDIKRYARVERIPGGHLEDSRVLNGIIINKDVLHPKMRRRIEHPRVICLDMPLEYNKGESQTNIEISKEADFDRYLQIEEEWVLETCRQLIALKPDVVVTEKGCSELAQHYLMKGGVTVLRRMRKTDNTRLALATGATIGHRVDMLKECDVGTKCGLYEVRHIASEVFSFFVECDRPKACSIILRGGSKDILQEMDRNLQDAMCVTRNILQSPKILPGGGATEMAVSCALNELSNKIDGSMRFPYQAVASALEVIPRTLVSNCGKQPIKVLTELRAMQQKSPYYGIDGLTGEIVNMHDYGIWEPYVVKLQTIKTAIESAAMLLRIDDVVSGLRNHDND